MAKENTEDNKEKSTLVLKEEKILDFWREKDIFKKTLEKESPEGEFVFHDGPPFATGAPHYGHLVASAIKDAIPRYKTMRGFHVDRKWGWDCHGLPIENIVEKELGTKSKKDIEKIGVKKFNELCREKIFTYIDVWNEFIPRFGRWADMENPYKTMDTSFMESEWWAFKELYDKGLVYEDFRSMHICPRCETTLAQSEVAEGYKDIKDLAVTVKFQLKDEPKTFLLAWTTTPWTLPGNVALAVGSDVKYVKWHVGDTAFILAEAQAQKYFPDFTREDSRAEDISVESLIGKEYIPPFDSYVNDESLKNRENGWKIYAVDFVTDDSGTGIAHEAPAFGAEDLELAQKENIPVIKHVGMDGIIASEVKELAGLSVKPIDDHQATDVAVIKYLAGKDLLFSKEKYEHSYPHCWRCDTPLINYATSSWFVAVQKIKDGLVQNSSEIKWSPEHIKNGRWGGWIDGARDWSISRQRFWANTIPVWRCGSCKKERVFGSVADLQTASGKEVTDLHKDIVDDVIVKCECGSDMHRVPDVLDTWFDSGSVPYAAHHYPFENKEKVETNTPADFIAEGQDQVSKWFYYQHVLGEALFNKPAFKNVIVNGIVVSEVDGKKLSKRLQNYPDPQLLIDKYGADAVRLYLLSSPVVRAENLTFKEGGVDEVMKKVMARLHNVLSFYELYKDSVKHGATSSSTNILDQWIVARLNQTVEQVTSGMEEYELDRATRPLTEFVDDLSTWYIRRSRDRFKGDDEEDKKLALGTTRFVMREFAKVLAPFTPFIADHLYLALGGEKESVHLDVWPEIKAADKVVLETMSEARRIVSLALELRAKENMKVRQPLARLTVKSTPFFDEMVSVIKDEVNVKEVVFDESLSEDVALDTVLTPELKAEGHARDLIRTIQSLRKQEKLSPSDIVQLAIQTDEKGKALVEKFKEEIERVASVNISFENVSSEPLLIEEMSFALAITITT
ncbi:isoleucine--tRNA ligase [Candidatus Wolfebacteria bacterium]|nr:MAG: isoleucine--tRNA ligase [Candidatus Wolfebacteria bacterium]